MFQAATHTRLRDGGTISPPVIQNHIKQQFIEVWDQDRRVNRKLNFYNSIKGKFGLEGYLNEGLKHRELVSVARLRTSADKLKVESGRYGDNRASLAKMACPVCSDLEAVEYLSE